MTPSNRILIDLSLKSAGTVKVFRYQAIPQGKNAVQLASLESKDPSMLQSWGRSSVRQCASTKSGSCALASSPWKNFHCSVKSMSRPASSATVERVTMGVLSLIVGVPAPAATISNAPTAVASQGRANERLITSVASNDLLAVDVSFQPSTAARVQRLSATFDFKRTVLDMGIALVDSIQDMHGFLDATVANSWLVRQRLL